MGSAPPVAGEEALPPSADTRMIETNGQTLHTVIAGPEDGPPVVLLHGFPEFWYGWRYQIPALVDAGYRVIVPDQRGYNKSSKPRGLAAYTIDNMVADTEGLIDALGYDRVSMVGHDWGAGVTWQTLLRVPERVDRAGILNVPHPVVFEEYLSSEPSQLLKSWYMFTFQLPRIAEWAYSAGDWYGVRRVFLSTANRADAFTDADIDHYRRAWERPGAFTGMLNWYRAIFRKDAPDPPTATVDVPTIVIWGTQDPYLHRGMARDSHEYCTDGRVELLNDATHWLQHERPDRVNELLLDHLTGAD
ncbi:MAG: alpha/beta fold hydrolase [Haloarculaceae archaeon]